MASKLRNYRDRVNKNVIDKAGLIIARIAQVLEKLDLFLFWPISKSVINFQPDKSFACSDPDICAVEVKR
jgi:hypothetical protein